MSTINNATRIHGIFDPPAITCIKERTCLPLFDLFLLIALNT